MPIIDIHTHCSPPRPPGDRFGVVEALRGTPIGKNTVTNYRGLPAVSYHEMGDFELQQETCARAGMSRAGKGRRGGRGGPISMPISRNAALVPET